jgi:hypothetical protein
MGALPYEPKNVFLILVHQEVSQETLFKELKGTIILKANHGVLQGQGKDFRTAILIDRLDYMP